MVRSIVLLGSLNLIVTQAQSPVYSGLDFCMLHASKYKNLQLNLKLFATHPPIRIFFMLLGFSAF